MKSGFATARKIINLSLMCGILLISTADASQSEIKNCKAELSIEKISREYSDRSDINFRIGMEHMKPTKSEKIQNWFDDLFGTGKRDLHGEPQYLQVTLNSIETNISGNCKITYRYWESKPHECSHRIDAACESFLDPKGKEIVLEKDKPWQPDVVSTTGWHVLQPVNSDLAWIQTYERLGKITQFVQVWKTILAVSDRKIASLQTGP